MIRALEPGDRPEWLSLYQGYQAFYGWHDRPAGFYDKVFARLMSGQPGEFRGLVHADAGRLLGLAHFVFHPNLWREEGVCYLQDLFTAPQARGRGIGRALIEAVYAQADLAGVPSVYWLTAEDNYPGRMLYDRIAVKSPFIRYVRQG
ncbi:MULTISPECIES: GNAT family N-acetyltransferase [unclassified Paracoccus (in: a-proteobacteria)]|uniref:GNAT family N-acetyltransferase n=1 Tax=unclassified Paracoccus (in: a-proteobacteria) TaxID=2688777 RepID=UPI0012B219F3|nr:MULTISPECIES: GNAT family N-acetyltransferase [unclassified Paracoccus (in: a-proteobacteria)]UXU75294.1 GNAT family N-acetyltransferase [Paracoccus sp. SMMA_5]UXU81196.1 GNAT family N-acetyltransferase [Paracoccus sp. SMMA_5_TC]